MKEAIVILTLMGCDHGENNCTLIETASQSYGSEIACLRDSEDQILGMDKIEHPIILADCAVQSQAVVQSDVEELLENELHEPPLTQDELVAVEVAQLETPRRPLANALGAIKDISSNAIGTAWQVTVKSTSAINPF